MEVLAAFMVTTTGEQDRCDAARSNRRKVASFRYGQSRIADIDSNTSVVATRKTGRSYITEESRKGSRATQMVNDGWRA
jgi:hypothetical protein